MPKSTKPKSVAQQIVKTTASPLLAPQVRILDALAGLKGNESMTNSQLQNAATIPPKWVPEYIGGPNQRVPGEFVKRSGKPTSSLKLWHASLVQVIEIELDGGKFETNYRITAKGRQRLASVLKKHPTAGDPSTRAVV